jgi:deoxyribose-phosphate aldolase
MCNRAIRLPAILLGALPIADKLCRSMKALAANGARQVSRPNEWAIPSVDQIMAEERANAFKKRSIKTSAKLSGLKLAVSMMDLTTLEGKDTPGKVAFLCRKAMQPLDPRYEVPACAAVCVYPNLVKVAKKFLGKSGVKVASVATAFPTGLMPLRLKLQEVRSAAHDGADEIDMVINRGVFLAGEHNRVFDEIAATREACGDAHLKVILETGELQTYDNVRIASEIAMRAGADFIKTSTGKVSPAATMPVTLVMLEAIRDYFYETGIRIGMKPAGGIRNAKEALAYLVMLKETLGDDWLTPDLFRFGASTLVNDVLMQIVKTVDGNYQGPDYFSLP